MRYSKEVLVKLAKFTKIELDFIQSHRRDYNHLGVAYQLAFVKFHNRLPSQNPLEIIEELLAYVGMQLSINADLIKEYSKRQPTISAHQSDIRTFLNLSRFNDIDLKIVEQYIFEQSCQLEQTHALLASVKDFLRQQKILAPAESTLKRLIQQERHKARNYIFEKIYALLSKEQKQHLDKLLKTNGGSFSTLHSLKQTPDRASSNAIIKIAEKLDIIESLGVLNIDLSWLNNNLQRWMNRYVRKTTATRLRELKEKRRYAFLVCFLKQHYQDMTDNLVKTYDKLMNQMYSRTELDLDKHHRKQRKSVKNSLATFEVLAATILDESIIDVLVRKKIFDQISKEDLSDKRKQVKDWLSGKHKDVFTLFVNNRFGYLRKFAPTLLEHLSIEKEDAKDDSIIQAVDMLKELNQSGKRKLDESALQRQL